MTDPSKRFGKRPVGYPPALAIFCFLWAGFAFFYVNVSHAARIEVNAGTQGFKIIAEEAPLMDVLNELSRQARFSLVTEHAPGDTVTLNIAASSIEDCIRQLVQNKNYAMYYEKLKDGSVTLTEVRLFENNANGPPSPPAPMQPPQDGQLHFDPAVYRDAFSNKAALAKQFEAKTPVSPKNEHPPGLGGIQVTHVALDSIFGKIGISKGDILHNVNGKSISTKKAFINSIQWSPEDPSMIRIERTTESGQIAPIYLYIDQTEPPQ